MIPSRCKPFVVISLAFAAASAVNAQEPTVVAISATAGGPTTFVFAGKEAGEPDRVVSSSLLIQSTLLPALLTGAKPVVVDLLPKSNVIRRVTPFAPGNGPTIRFEGDYLVSRIATQRKTDGTDEHLEVFLKKAGGDEEKAHNVSDRFLQQMLIAAFRKDGLVDVQFDGGDIATVTLGQKLPRK